MLQLDVSNEDIYLNNAPVCPRCGSHRIRQCGRYKGTLDYKCPDCLNSVLAFPNSAFANNFPAKNLNSEQMYKSDVWDIRVFGLTLSNYESYTLNFSTITPQWLKNAAKQWLKYRIDIDIDAGNTLISRLNSICHFAKFIKEHYPGLQPEYINRDLLVVFFTYLSFEYPRDEKRNEALGYIGQFLECCSRFSWIIEVPQERLIFLEDFAKENKWLARFVPDYINKQLEDNLEALPETVACMVKVLKETGINLIELCSLEFDCLSQDAIGKWWIDVYKTQSGKKIKSITISIALVTAVQRQQEYIKENLGAGFTYLFCETKKYTWFAKYSYQKPPTDIKPMKLKYFEPKPDKLHMETLRGYLNQLADESKIIDAAGRTFPLGRLYQLRNTHRTELINDKFPQYKYNHLENKGSVSDPIAPDDETMKRKMEKFCGGKLINIKGEEIESLNPKLDNPQLQWFEKNIESQGLPHGWCLLPIFLTCHLQGDHCLNCNYFTTSKKFLLVLKKQLKNTEKLIEKAEHNGCQRQIETNKVSAENLRKMINSLERLEC